MALGLFGISALVVAFIISKYYPPEILGIFNINFALLIILSQMASGGIHYSVLYRLSKNLSAEQNRIIFTNGLTAGIIVAFIATLIIFLLKDYFSILFDSASDTEFIIFIIPAIFLLAVNKILLAYCNAKRKMKLFALANVIRSFILLISIIIFIIYEFNPKAVAGIFTLSELVVFIIYFILSQNSLSGN